jgi:uroporphyrinogen decarboxylase
VEDYRAYALPSTTELVRKLQATGVPIIYFGTDSATLLPAMKETGAEVIGVDWRIPLDRAWQSIDFKGSVQGNLDPVLLFANWQEIEARAKQILQQVRGHNGHIFNLGHGILPETPVENVKALAAFVHEHSSAGKTRDLRAAR